MDRELILRAGMNKYFKAALPMVQYQSENANFDELLEFIGKHNRTGRKNDIGSAYVAIRKKTDELLGLTGTHSAAKTSKREVSSIRFYYNRISIMEVENGKFVKIPFKIAYIFRAIDLIVNDICAAGHEIPICLKKYIHKTYSDSFYSVHVQAYDYCRTDIPIDKVAPRALNDDLHGAFSPLNDKFM